MGDQWPTLSIGREAYEEESKGKLLPACCCRVSYCRVSYCTTPGGPERPEGFLHYFGQVAHRGYGEKSSLSGSGHDALSKAMAGLISSSNGRER